MSLVTPSEPAPSHRLRSTRERSVATQHGECATAWSNLGIAAASARGQRHHVNEDCHSRLDGVAPVFVVADGVGGGAMAAWTSRKLVADLHRSLERDGVDDAAVRRALLDADRAIAQRLVDRNAASGAATAVVCVGTGPLRATWIVAWVGDCRVYRVGHAAAAQLLTHDDTYGHLGEQPPPGGSFDDPARMIGNGAVSNPNVARATLSWDEMLVLVSDGVHKHLDPEAMARVLRNDIPLERRCLQLVEAARSNGSEDDATALVIHRRMQPRARLVRHGVSLVATLVVAALLVAWSDHAGGAPLPSSPPHTVPQPECSP